MPHLTLEYSSNLKASSLFRDLMDKFHKILSIEGGIEIENCKSRVRQAEEFFIAKGESQKAFVHLDLIFLDGRSLELKQKLGDLLLSEIDNFFTKENRELEIQITVEIRDISHKEYFKLLRENSLN